MCQSFLESRRPLRRVHGYSGLLLGALCLLGCDAGSESAATAGAPSVTGGMANTGTGGASAATGGTTSTETGGAPAGTASGTGGATTDGGTSNENAGTGAGVAASGGASGGPANGGGAGASGGSLGLAGGANGTFTLAWQDDFNTLDTSMWQLQNFTYDGNQATFSPENAKVANGILTISLTAAASGAAKPYLGVEMRSAKTLTYGKVSARMRFATGSGVVSGLVLFYTPYPNCDWNEIDIEHLGKSTNSSQFNAMVFTGTQVPNCTTSVTPTQDPLVADLGFNAETDYHQYDIEWTPSGVWYIADGVVLRDWTANIALLKRAQTILLTIWASNSASWAGALTGTSAPTSAAIDWIKVYDWHS